MSYNQSNLYKTIKILLLGFVSSFIAGCVPLIPPLIGGGINAANTEEQVRAKTASYFGVSQDEINITNYSKNLMTTTYQLRLKGKFYNCMIYVGDLNCDEPGT